MNKESKMLLVKEVLSPLLEIIYLYKRSQAYNYVPDRKEDCDAGWNYFENKFNKIYKGLNENIFLTEIEYILHTFSGCRCALSHWYIGVIFKRKAVERA